MCDGLVLELAEAGGEAKRRFEGKCTGTYEKANSAVKRLLIEKLTVTIVLLNDMIYTLQEIVNDSDKRRKLIRER
jgi:hypothetical protein